MASILIAVLPGLLSLASGPALARVGVDVALSAAGGEVDTPRQMAGTAAGVPSLVPSSVTRTSAEASATGAAGSNGGSGEPPKGALPLEQRDGGEWATGQDERALPSGAQRAEQLDAACCAPWIDDRSPSNFALVDTLTPLLLVKAGSANGMDYTFKVCNDGSMLSGCFSSSVQSDVYTWRVPAAKLKWGKQYYWQVTVKDRGTLAETVSTAITFTTGVRQLAVGSQLAARGPDGQEFDPVSGNYTTAMTDVQVAAAGPPLSVTRSYNTFDPRSSGMFGAGWSTRWDMKIVAADTALLVTQPDGRVLRFGAKGDGTFQPPPGMYATLAEQASGGWRLMEKSSTSYLFDANGRLTKITDSRGRSQDLAYDGAGKLATVTAVGGRSLRFDWTGSHVSSVSTDPVDGQALTLMYTYDADRLMSVCAPDAEPACTRYDYGSGSNYRAAVLDSLPYGYWRLNEPSGTQVADLGWGAGPGTTSTATRGQPGALAGTADTSTTFKSTGMTLQPNVVGRLAGQASVETWFKTTKPGTVFAAGPSVSAYSALYIGTDGKLRGQFLPSDSEEDTEQFTPITTTATVTDGQWHHVVLTADNGTDRLYLDGQLVGSLSMARALSWQGEARFAIGPLNWLMPAGSSTGNFALDGQLDEAALYDRPLTQAEVQAHYAAARSDARNKLAKVTTPAGRVWASNTYDAVTDRIKTHTDQNGGTWQIGEQVVDKAEGTSTVTVTDPNNEKVSTVHDAWRGYRLVTRTDQLGQQTDYRYDTGGFLASTIDANENVTTLANDERGNPIRQTTRRSGIDYYVYFSYYFNKDDKFDPRNDRLTAVRDGRSSSATDNTYATTLEYNAYGEQTKQTSPATTDFPNGRSVTVAYTDGSETAVGGGTTPAGLAKTRTDPKGNSWSYAYTAAGDLAEQSGPEGLVTKLAYDVLGRLTSTATVSDAYPDGVTTTVTYDALGRVTAVTGAAVKNEISGVTHTARTSYGYDLDGNKLSETIADLTGGDAERKVVYGYDTFGRLESVTDAEGGVTRQAWNTLGQKASTTDARGTVTAYAYSKRGELISTTLKGWTASPVIPQLATDVVLESRSYDPAGRLALRVDAMGRKMSYTYYADNRLSESIGDDVKLSGVTTPRDVVLEANTYDDAGNLVEQVTGGGIATTGFVYDAGSRLSSQTFDPTGLKRKTVFTYDANGNVIKSARTGAGSGTRTEIKEYAYNKLNQPTKETIENGDQDLVSTIGYDDRGLATSIVDPRGNVSGVNAADYTTTMRYDALDRLVETVAPQVQIDKAGTASQGRPTGKIGYDTVGSKTHQRDAEGRTLSSVFDKAGRLVSSSSPAYTPPGGAAVTPTTSNGYDAAGQLIRTTDERGYVTTFDYDQLGRQVRITDPAPDGQTAGTWVTEYDLAGEKLATVDATGARTEATYDDLGRQITATQIERKPATAAYTTTMEYDDAGRLKTQIAPGNKTTGYKVNAAGEVITVTDPLTNKTTMDYDLAGRLVKTTDPNGNATTAEYDLAGRKIAAKDLDATGAVVRTYGFGYDPAGNQTSSTSPEGYVTKQTFDALNRATSLIEPVSASESITTIFGYDATGARTRLTDGRGNATWTSYNSLGLVETVTEPSTAAHPDLADRTWTHIYDAAGNQTATLQPGGVRIDRTFDHLGSLTKETGAGGGAATAERTFGYDLAGRAITAGDLTIDYNDRSLPVKTFRAGVQESAYAYDALGNSTQRIDAAGTATFTYDNANRLATATDPVTSRTLTYGYDPASRLKTITATSGQASTQTIDYDNMDRVTGHTLKNGSGTQLAKITYGWDKDDNLTTKTTTGLAGAGTNSYTYDHAGRLTSWTAPGGAVTAYEWDAAGNRTKAGDKTFTYDERNRLISGDGTDYTYTPRGTLASQTKSGTTTQLTFDAFDRLIADGDSLYAYDALDRVTSRISGTTKQTQLYAGLSNDLAAISVSGGIQSKYARDPFGALLGLQEGTTPAAAAMSDLHGDLVATYQSALASSTSYDPFGEITAQTGGTTNLGYQGEYTDPDTGKVNMHARWYQPGTGTFTSRDTATLDPSPSVQANRYTYANATPLTGTDPTGHMTIYAPDGSGGYSANGDNGGQLGPRPGQLVVGTPEYDNLIAAPGGLYEGVWNVVRVMSKEDMRMRGHLPNGTQISDNFWRLLDEDINQIIEMAYLGATDGEIGILIQYAKLHWKQEWIKEGRPTAISFGPVDERLTECEKALTIKTCAKMIEAAALLVKAQKYYDLCAGPHPGDPLGWNNGKCQRLVTDLGLSTHDKAQLAAKKSWEEAKAFWTGVYDVVVEDFTDCFNGSAVGCLLAASNFVPGGALARAGKFIARFPKVEKAVRAAGIACTMSSFVPGTRVLMADGSRKPIEDVRVGDEVLATDPASGESVAKKVTALINSSGAKDLVKITIKTERAGEAGAQSITATAQHPFWVPSLREWIDATYLRPGDWLQTSTGTWTKVQAVNRWFATQQVYNLTVAETHTYYVGVGDADTLVHNAGPCDIGSVLRNWTSKTYRFGNQTLLLDKKGMAHILARHHPKYWDGSVKSSQSFFDGKMSISDIENIIMQVMQANRSTLLQRGSRGMYQISAEVNGMKYVLGLNNGRVGQFYPVAE
ncbi:LamG-like jellyroll fold domain-containing protein [Nonomuraea sp. NPDC049784]|uniref:LamG-like jellyroll fold domain-containing protein n=1 Tax=Nonomuraea sp. NPDC049784 TaxID=3154361 RepID=UPI0033EEB4C6